MLVTTCDRKPRCGLVSATWSSRATSVTVCAVIQLVDVNTIGDVSQSSWSLSGVMVTSDVGWLMRRIVYVDVTPPSATAWVATVTTSMPGLSLSVMDTTASSMVNAPGP